MKTFFKSPEDEAAAEECLRAGKLLVLEEEEVRIRYPDLPEWESDFSNISEVLKAATSVPLIDVAVTQPCVMSVIAGNTECRFLLGVGYLDIELVNGRVVIKVMARNGDGGEGDDAREAYLVDYARKMADASGWTMPVVN